MVSSDITRVPVRLAQEDGSTIELDVTSLDIVVERSNSQIAVPFRDGQRFGIDMNMPQISVALTGVLVDDEGTNVPATGALAEFDFGSTLFHSAATNAGTIHSGGIPGAGGGGNTAIGTWLPTTQLGIHDPFSAVQNINEIDKLYFELPVDYLTSGTGQLGAPSSPVTGMSLHLDAGQGITKGSASGSVYEVTQWSDQSGNSRHASQSTSTNKPLIYESIFGGQSAVWFSTNDYLSISGAGAALNPEEYTIFVVMGGSRSAVSPGPVLGNKGSSNEGYALFYTGSAANNTTDTTQLSVYQSGGIQTTSLPDDTVGDGYTVPHIITAQVSGSSGSQVVTIRNNGLTGATTNSLTLVERTSGDFEIGRDAGTSSSVYFEGYIAEILIYPSALSNANLLKNESYLANKYNITLDPEHTYYGANAAAQTTHIRFILDALSKGTVKEPHYYLNHQRATDLIVSGYNTSTKVVSFSSGDAREWFELGSANRVAKDATSAYFGTVTAIAANGSTITVSEANASTRPSSGALYIAPWRTADMQHKPDIEPVISIPVRDLLTPRYSKTYQNGAFRDTDGAQSATELFTYRVAAAIASSDSLGANALIEGGGTSSGSVFSVKRSLGANGLSSYLEIEQRRKIDLTNTALTLRPSRPLEVKGNRPIMTNFTGGRAGNFIKSAGDKAQDLIGILNNSQNFFKGNKTNSPAWLSALENIYSNYIYNIGAARDYIHGVQIPYMSTVNREYATTVNNPTVRAVASSASDAVITNAFGNHNLAVGDTIEVTVESALFGSITTSLIGTHVVKSVTSPTVFTIELDTSANTLSLFGSSANPLLVMINYQTETPELFNVPYVQRNFFLTTGNAVHTLDKTSVRNMTPAKTAFDINQDGHRKSGIQVAIDEFNVNFNAEDRLYEFDMTMLAVDYLL